MTCRGRYKATEWSEFESYKSGLQVKQRCKHCKKNISSKIERLREHLKKCVHFAKKAMGDSSSDECLDLEIDDANARSLSVEEERDFRERMTHTHSSRSTSETETNINEHQPASASTSKRSSCAGTAGPVRPAGALMDSFVSSTPVKRSSSVNSLSSSASSSSLVSKSNTSDFPTPHKKVKKISTILPSMDRFLQKTSEAEKRLLDMQFARTFFACNIPFNVADNKHMKDLITMLRGGSYINPTRRQLGSDLLDSVYEECKKTLEVQLDSQIVTLIQDGWSNIHNQPIIATCLHNGTKSFFIRSVDTGSEKKTAEYCADIAEKEIDYCESTYKCQVTSNKANK